MTIAEVKEYDSKLEQKTVVNTPDKAERQAPSAQSFLLQVAEQAQTIVPWGHNPVQRDKELRDFWHSESWLASVVYSVSIRNASFAWQVIGSNPEKKQPRNTINAVTKILKNSDRGNGWRHLMLKTCIDLYTADNAAFWEIIRNGRGPSAPVVNIAHLDSARCARTGDPKWPVIYTDRYGKETFLPYWRVQTIEELPSPVETAYNMQYSAVSRALMAAEIIQSISTYKLEKVSGNFTRSLDIVAGVTQNNLDDGLALAQEQVLNAGLLRFSLPVIIPGIDPTATLSHIHIDLASLPDNFDEDTSFKWYVAQLAAAFGVDYQEIAPLMTGNLGSSQQSEIMHLKTRGKGPALIMGMIEDKINELFPSNVEFKFLEQDIRSEREKAETQFTRSKDRSMRVKTGELTSQAARELAVLSGDMPRWLKDEVDKEEKKQEREQKQEMEQRVNEDRSEFGAEQLEQGVESNGERQPMTMEDVKQMQKMITEHPYDMMQSWYKASIGHPSGTVIMPVKCTDRSILHPVLAQLAKEWGEDRVRFLPLDTYHITLVHSSLVDQHEFKEIYEHITKGYVSFPFVVEAESLDYFDTENGKAVVLKIGEDAVLADIQNRIYQQFVERGISVSEYSNPKKWQPHITLAYIDNTLDVPNVQWPNLTFICHDPQFTRSAYAIEFAEAVPYMDNY